MDEDQERRSGNFDDLFEDLDRFFQSGEHPTDEELGGPAGEAEASADAPRPAATGSPHPPGEEGSSGTAWLPDLDERADLTERPAVRQEDPSVSVSGPEPRIVVPSEEPPPSRPRVPAGAPAHAEQDEWDKLRSALDDGGYREDPDLSLAAAPPASTAGDPLFDFLGGDEDVAIVSASSASGPPGSGDEDDEPGELTLEDLKKPPPEYRDLPGAEIGAPAGGDDSSPDEPEVLDELFGEEPDIADVELAADQLAREFAPDEFAADEEADEDGGLPEAEDDAGVIAAPARPPRRTVQVREPESLTGPSWEEPTSRVVTNEPPGPRVTEDRNLPAAILTAVGLAAFVVVCVFIRPWLFTAVAGLVVLAGLWELYTTMQRRGFKPASALGLVVGAMMIAGAYFQGEPGLLAFVGLGLVASFLWYMASGPEAREGVARDAGVTVLGMVYLPFLASYYVLILTRIESGRAVMLAVLGVTFLYDAAAYIGGSLWGSRAIAPNISPRKSVEGLIVATVVTIFVGGGILSNISPFDLKSAAAMAVLISVFAPLGDLAESMLKRDLGVKDMGSILPGHGGILDRIDSALVVGIAAFYLLRLILT
jgi:phosphatidate cytidylyltransferase